MTDGNILGFDFGTKYIGVALGNSLIKSASGLPTIVRKNKIYDWQQLTNLIQKWQPVALIVGEPLTMDGKSQEISQLADKFTRQLSGRFNIPVCQIDERLTSVEAQVIMEQNNIKKTKTKIDQIAATLILQAWFDTND